jgi:cell division protein FtsI/penicillin-binding protein 2
VLVLLFGGLGTRLFYIQILQHDFFTAYAEEKHLARSTLYPVRGTIFDRSGEKILAKSKRTKAIFVNPSIVGNPEMTKDAGAVISKLADILDLDEATVRARASARTGDGRFRGEVMLKRKPSDEQIEAIEAFRTDKSIFVDVPEGDEGKTCRYRYRGIYLRDRDERVYPSETALCHVIGFMRDQSPPGLEIIRDDTNPQRGIELALDDYLRGAEGWRIKEVDKIRREVISEKMRENPAVNGYNVVLTIDLNIQFIVENEISQAAGDVEFDTCSVIVMDPATGEILAMAGFPNFDSNRIAEFRDDIIRNHPVETVYEPGSTMKPITGCIALELGAVGMDSIFYCEKGAWHARRGFTLHDAHRFEDLTFREIIEKSSNIGIAKVSLLIGEKRLHENVLRFGFNKRTGIGLREERAGFVWPLNKWSKLSIYEVPMGHELSVTSLQLANAYCTIANGGNLMKPILVKRIEDENGNLIEETKPEIVRNVLSRTTTNRMKAALTGVVSESGTARRADITGYTEAGKTGTAQKIVDGRYSHKIFDTSFVGFAPVKDPRVVILVAMNGTRKPNHYAGTVAAPVFARIGEQVLRYLEVPKDAPDEIRASASNL